MIGFGLQGGAMAGYVDVTGWPDRSPIAPWGAYTDFVSPRFALAALVAALRYRDRVVSGSTSTSRRTRRACTISVHW